MSDAGLRGIKRLTKVGISSITSFALVGMAVKTFNKFMDIDFKFKKKRWKWR